MVNSTKRYKVHNNKHQSKSRLNQMTMMIIMIFLGLKNKNNWLTFVVIYFLTLDNMEDIPKAMALKLGKKKSILRKDSFLNVSTLSWKN